MITFDDSDRNIKGSGEEAYSLRDKMLVNLIHYIKKKLRVFSLRIFEYIWVESMQSIVFRGHFPGNYVNLRSASIHY